MSKPLDVSFSTLSNTPLKSGGKACLLCGSVKEPIMVNGRDPSIKILLSKYLQLQVEDGCVCRSCKTKLQRVHDTIKKLKETFHNNQARMKRMLPFADSKPYPSVIKSTKTSTAVKLASSQCKIAPKPPLIPSTQPTTLMQVPSTASGTGQTVAKPFKTSTVAQPTIVYQYRKGVEKKNYTEDLIGMSQLSSKPSTSTLAKPKAMEDHAYTKDVAKDLANKSHDHQYQKKTTSSSKQPNPTNNKNIEIPVPDHSYAKDCFFDWDKHYLKKKDGLSKLVAILKGLETPIHECLSLSQILMIQSSLKLPLHHLAECLLSIPTLHSSIVRILTCEIRASVKTMTARIHGASILMKKSYTYLLHFNWDNILVEMCTKFPDLLTLCLALMVPSSSSHDVYTMDKVVPKLCSVFGIMLQHRVHDLSLVQRIVTVCLQDSISDQKVLNCLDALCTPQNNLHINMHANHVVINSCTSHVSSAIRALQPNCTEC